MYIGIKKSLLFNASFQGMFHKYVKLIQYSKYKDISIRKFCYVLIIFFTITIKKAAV